MDNKKVLITGISGFIGRKLAEFLIDKGYEVYGISRDNSDLEGIKSYSIDLTKENRSIVKIMDKADAVVHLAAVLRHDEESKKIYENNMLITKNVLNAFEISNARKFIFISSTKVYGKLEKIPSDENEPIKPFSDYGRAKADAEQLILASYENSKKEYIILRCTFVYGPKQGKNFIIPTIINQIKEGDIVRLLNSNIKRDFLYYKDLLEAVKLAIDKRFGKIKIYNVATSKAVSIREIINIIAGFYSKSITVKDKADSLKEEGIVEEFDIGKIKKDLGWAPMYPIEEGLNRILKKIDNR